MKSRIGMQYWEGLSDRPFSDQDPCFTIFRVVSDHAEVAGCVSVENAAGQQFPVETALIDNIAVSPALST